MLKQNNLHRKRWEHIYLFSTYQSFVPRFCDTSLFRYFFLMWSGCSLL